MKKVVVIGGGVIGLFCAYYLRKAGFEVTVLEKNAPESTEMCSYGNAGFICTSHIMALASPGAIAKGLRWLTNPKSPLFIKPRLSLSLVKWLWRFYRSATLEHVQKSTTVFRDLQFESRSLYKQFVEDEKARIDFTESGLLIAYSSKKTGQQEAEISKMANEIGIQSFALSKKEIMDKLDGADLKVSGGFFYPDDCILHPAKLVEALRMANQKLGTNLIYEAPVDSAACENGRLKSVKSGIHEYEADEFVLATGSWTPVFGKGLGLKIPVQAGKGYSLTIANPEVKIPIPIILEDAKVAITPLPGLLRIAGTMEIAGLDLSITKIRVESIKEAVRNNFTGVSENELTEAKGERRDLPYTACEFHTSQGKEMD